MLVIRCREGESVDIGDDIRMSVLGIDAGRVKLGFTAPSSVAVTRKSVDLDRAQNHNAAGENVNHVLGHLGAYLSPKQDVRFECVVTIEPQNNFDQRAKQFGVSAEEVRDGGFNSRRQGRTPDGT